MEDKYVQLFLLAIAAISLVCFFVLCYNVSEIKKHLVDKNKKEDIDTNIKQQQ